MHAYAWSGLHASSIWDGLGTQIGVWVCLQCFDGNCGVEDDATSVLLLVALPRTPIIGSEELLSEDRSCERGGFFDGRRRRGLVCSVEI